MSVIKLTNMQLRELNTCWNMIYRRIFNSNKWESVKLFIFGLGRLDSIHLRAITCLKFVKSISLLSNSVLMCMFSIITLNLTFVISVMNLMSVFTCHFLLFVSVF